MDNNELREQRRECFKDWNMTESQREGMLDAIENLANAAYGDGAMERKKMDYSDMRWNGHEWEIHMGYPLGHVSLNDELSRLQSENAELKARLEKAVELPIDIGDTVYRKGRFSDGIVQAEVKQIVKSKFGLTFKAARGDNTYFSFDEEVIGERIFLTEAEALAKLEEVKGGAE